MSALTIASANEVLDFLLGTNPAATRWVALFTVAPTASTPGTEVTGGSYVRQVFVADPAANAVTQNTDLISFPTANADEGTAVAFGIFDAETGGELKLFSPLQTAKAIGNGDTAEFAPGDLTADAS